MARASEGRRASWVMIFCAAAASVLIVAGAAHAQWLGRLIYQENSLYHRIFVYRYGSVVTLQFGARHPMLLQSQVDLGNMRRHVQEYSALVFSGLLYQPEPKRMLLLGLGGGVIPREMRHYFPELEIDVVEIDPAIPPVAERFFGFRKDDKLSVHVSDGRMFIRKQLRSDPVPKYDLVVLDAYNSDYIPFHLMTREFFEQVKGILADDGVIVANVLYNSRLCDAELKTFLAVFGRCQVFMGVHSTNAMLVAPGASAPTLTAKEASLRATSLQRQHGFAFDLTTVAMRLRPNTLPDPRAIVLTDDQAPVNWLRLQETSRMPAP